MNVWRTTEPFHLRRAIGGSHFVRSIVYPSAFAGKMIGQFRYLPPRRGEGKRAERGDQWEVFLTSRRPSSISHAR